MICDQKIHLQYCIYIYYLQMIYIRLVVVFLEKFPDYSNVINTPLQNADLRRCF